MIGRISGKGEDDEVGEVDGEREVDDVFVVDCPFVFAPRMWGVSYPRRHYCGNFDGCHGDGDGCFGSGDCTVVVVRDEVILERGRGRNFLPISREKRLSGRFFRCFYGAFGDDDDACFAHAAAVAVVAL
jgi:hypothetical protein